VRTGKRYHFSPEQQALARRVHSWVANEAIEQGIYGPLSEYHWKAAGSSYTFHRTSIPLRTMTNAQLLEVSRNGQLALTLEEMQTIQQHFQSLDRDPTDIELETIAQTWSEHCSHKTLKGRIVFMAARGAMKTCSSRRSLLQPRKSGIGWEFMIGVSACLRTMRVSSSSMNNFMPASRLKHTTARRRSNPMVARVQELVV
jgi:phosphoribosylformylglycinamidine synthase